jgi:8-oxo-dGTP pyrophosphatase MutT (NUDIX family)
MPGTKRPVSVLVLIHTPALAVLLLERAAHPGFWQSVTGSQEDAEDLLETARREVLEETGIAALADLVDFLAAPTASKSSRVAGSLPLPASATILSTCIALPGSRYARLHRRASIGHISGYPGAGCGQGFLVEQSGCNPDAVPCLRMRTTIPAELPSSCLRQAGQ